MSTRRDFLGIVTGGAMAMTFARAGQAADAPIVRSVPGTQETLPVIGLGSADTVRKDNAAEVRALLERFLALGGRVVDTSPMYGDAEEVLGQAMAAAGLADRLWLATKVWTDGAAAGERQLAESRRLLGRTPLDLVQVHNLRDWRAHLATLRAARERGELRHVGITHYTDGAHAELEAVLRAERIDFVQLNYNIQDSAAEQRLLPAAAERGVAVLVNRPFEDGALFRRVKGKPLPGWALDAGIASWGQFFLKWIVGHPAVSCVIPATSKLAHLEDNMAAARGVVPDAALRQRMREHFATL